MSPFYALQEVPAEFKKVQVSAIFFLVAFELYRKVNLFGSTKSKC